MTGQAVLMKELVGLPPEYMGEVTDFVAWLKHRKLPFGDNGNTELSSRIDERRKMFAPFCGIWTDQDVAEFKEAVKDFETVNPEDWQ